MLQSNSNFERAVLPERTAYTGAAGSASGYTASADDTETRQVPVLGKTLLFRGELTAEEDVILQGRVEGSIRHARNLIIGTDGSVLGDVYASHLTVEGLVEGDLHCTEAVVVRATAQVRGNIFAPRVAITEGALFNGRIEMDPGAAQAAGQGGSRQGARQGGSRPGSQATPAAGRPAGASATGTPARSGAPAAPAASAQSTGAAATTGAPLANAAVDQLLSSQTSSRK